MLVSWVVVEVEKNILKILRILFINIMGITFNLLIISLISSIPLNLSNSLRLMRHKDHSPSELTHSKPEENNSLNLLSKEVLTLILLLTGVMSVSKSMKLKSQSVPHPNILLDIICFKVPHHSYQLSPLIHNHMKKFSIWLQLQEEKLLTLLNL